MIIVDEPEVYLHPDVQRQLLAILRETDPDIVLATHSTEIMGEADASEIVLIDKTRQSSDRLRDVEGLQAALDAVGSVQNITLTRLARNRRLLFMEGEDDYRLLRRFAQRAGFSELASGTDLTGIESGGFHSHSQVASFAWGIEKAMKGADLRIAAVFDRDYWCEEEVSSILSDLADKIDLAHFHGSKEIENYLLVPSSLQRSLESAVHEKSIRSGSDAPEMIDVEELLDEITTSVRAETLSQYVAKRVQFFGRGRQDVATVSEEAIRLFDRRWANMTTRLQIIPGKEVLSAFRTRVQQIFGVTLTDARIIADIRKGEIAVDMCELLERLEAFRSN